MITRNKDTANKKRFWDAVGRAGTKVAKWATWKQNVKVTMYSVPLKEVGGE